MPTLEIKLTIPEGTTIEFVGLNEVATEPPVPLEGAVERYFNHYLSNNGRKVFGAAARIEDFREKPGFTLEDLAANLSVDYESVKSWHRTSGRSAKRWRRETGTPEPIRFEWIDYGEFAAGDGERTVYRLPEEVAGTIRHLPVFQPGQRSGE